MNFLGQGFQKLEHYRQTDKHVFEGENKQWQELFWASVKIGGGVDGADTLSVICCRPDAWLYTQFTKRERMTLVLSLAS